MVNRQLLEPYIKNNVLSLEHLKEGNYPLYKYVRDNMERLKDSLDEYILDESKAIRGLYNLKAYLAYHYGEEVNLTQVRRDNVSVYNNICAIDNPEDVVSDLGFYVEYDRKITMDELKKELDSLVVNGLVGKLTKRLDNKLRYEGKKRGMTPMEYLESLGYTSSYGGEEYIDKSRKIKGE